VEGERAGEGGGGGEATHKTITRFLIRIWKTGMIYFEVVNDLTACLHISLILYLKINDSKPCIIRHVNL